MPRLQKDVQYNNFSNGLITEATGLSYPENSLLDVDNCDIELNGTIRRRLGLDQEVGGFSYGSAYFKDGLVANGYADKKDLALGWHLWSNPGNKANLYFIVLQVGNHLIVLDYNAEAVTDIQSIDQYFPDGLRVVSLNPYNNQIPASSPQTQEERDYRSATTQVSTSSGSGRLWVTSAAVAPFYLEYDVTGVQPKLLDRGLGYDGTGDQRESRPRIRDFNGVEDGLKVDERPVTLTDTHLYNLRNQGWSEQVEVFIDDDGDHTDVADPVLTSLTQNSYFPSNADVLWSLRQGAAKQPQSIGLVQLRYLKRQIFGNSPASKGHFIINAITGDKGDKRIHTDIPTQPEGNFGDEFNEPTTSGFRATGFFSGRLWLSGDENSARPNGVYFSQIIQKPSDAGEFLQKQDPTAEDFNNLLATDGGVLYIPEAYNIQHLEPYGAGMLVMAENGIWFIYGVDSGFTATSFSIEKISNTGIISSKSVVRTEQIVAFWGENSIYAIVLPESGIVPVLQDIGQTKIFDLYNNIDRGARKNVTGCFDTISKKTFWAYLDEENYSYPSKQNMYNKMLILDGRTGAFTKYSFETDSAALQYVGAPFPKLKGTLPRLVDPVVSGDDGGVLVGTEVVIAFGAPDDSDEFLNSIKTILINGQEDELRVGEFYDISFRDFNTTPSFAVKDYSSYLITAPETLGDFQRYKQATYLHSFFDRTEIGFQYNLDGDLVAKRPSGCRVAAHWDWNTSNASGHFNKTQKAYKDKRRYVPTGTDDPFDTGQGIVYTKLKVRGRGHAVSFKYESVPFTDFKLLGYSAAMTANGV